MFRVLIADDEQPARTRLRMMLEELSPDITITGEAENGKQAILHVRNKKPDALFLDIRMPVLDGFDVMDLLGDACPPVVFITAYDEHAIKAFEVHALDYLLKPVRKERLKETVDRLTENQSSKSRLQANQKLAGRDTIKGRTLLQKIPVNYKQEIRFVNHDEIAWVEADGKLTWVHTKNGTKYRTDFTLNKLEERLQGSAFFRVHRSAIANLDTAQKMEPWFKGGYRITLNNGTELDVARRRVSLLKKRLGM